jgi:hypothetical protein
MESENISHLQVQATDQATEDSDLPSCLSPDAAGPSTSRHYSYLRVTSTLSKERRFQKQQYVRHSHLLIISVHHFNPIPTSNIKNHLFISLHFTSLHRAQHKNQHKYARAIRRFYCLSIKVSSYPHNYKYKQVCIVIISLRIEG